MGSRSFLRNNMDYKIVEIFWTDAETIGDTGWMPLTEGVQSAKVPPPLMRTVGYVLVDHEDFISITDSLGDQECGHITKIPIHMIQRKTNLYEEDTMGDMDR